MFCTPERYGIRLVPSMLAVGKTTRPTAMAFATCRTARCACPPDLSLILAFLPLQRYEGMHKEVLTQLKCKLKNLTMSVLIAGQAARSRRVSLLDWLCARRTV